jgi:hypothetical protein
MGDETGKAVGKLTPGINELALRIEALSLLPTLISLPSYI